MNISPMGGRWITKVVKFLHPAGVKITARRFSKLISKETQSAIGAQGRRFFASEVW